MIQTLRITGVAAVAFAGVVLASVLGPVSLIQLDNHSQEKMAEILASPSAVDYFRELHAGNDQMGQDKTPPLVRQAEAFKDIIDPKIAPPAEVAKTTPAPRGGPPVKPVSTVQKFALLATACVPSNPSSSSAYVRLVDNTCQWVDCGSEVGHLLIKEVREDSIVCWDGHKDSEIPVETVPDRVSMLETDGETPAAAAPTPGEPLEVKIAEPPSSRNRLATKRLTPPVAPMGSRLAPDEQRSLGDLASRLRKLHGGPAGDDAVSDANRAAAIEKAIAEFKSSRISPEEARNLENLGGEPDSERERLKMEQTREFLKRQGMPRPPRN